MEEKEIDYAKVGDVIDGRFRILGKVREGSFGQIYKALDAKIRKGSCMKN